jgi:hypothetical protein
MKHSATLLAGLLVASFAGAGDVYVSTDAQGQKIYTDAPQTIPARKLDIHSQGADPSLPAKANSPVADPNDQQKSTRSKAQIQQAAQAMNEERAARCAEARWRYEALMNPSDIYTLDPNGEPAYLTTEQRSEARVVAKEFLDRFCEDH